MCINKWTIHFWYLCSVLNFSDEFRSVFNQFKGLILWFNSFFSHPKKRKKAKVSVSRAWDYDPKSQVSKHDIQYALGYDLGDVEFHSFD